MNRSALEDAPSRGGTDGEEWHNFLQRNLFTLLNSLYVCHI